MSAGVEFPDLERGLGEYLRPRLTEWGALVDREEPAFDPADSSKEWTPGYAVVLRDDSGPDRSLISASRRIGVKVIGADYGQTRRLAERVASLLRALPEALVLPVADASVRGPYSLDASSRVEFYLTAELVVVGRPISL